LAKNPVI
jgi:hypothetical protein